jgi:hypothetical protein
LLASKRGARRQSMLCNLCVLTPIDRPQTNSYNARTAKYLKPSV